MSIQIKTNLYQIKIKVLAEQPYGDGLAMQSEQILYVRIDTKQELAALIARIHDAAEASTAKPELLAIAAAGEN